MRLAGLFCRGQVHGDASRETGLATARHRIADALWQRFPDRHSAARHGNETARLDA
jgi:hypothetical protein